MASACSSCIRTEKVGGEHLTPYCDNYHLFLQSQTYNLSDLLHKGENALSALLGKGWYRADSARIKPYFHVFQRPIRLSLQAVRGIRGWKDFSPAHKYFLELIPSAVLKSDIYNGEYLDARLSRPIWCLPGGGARFRPVEVRSLHGLHAAG